MLFLRRQQIRHTEDEAFTRDVIESAQVTSGDVRANRRFTPRSSRRISRDRDGLAIAPGEFHIRLRP